MVSDVDNEGAHACVGMGSWWKTSIASSQFYQMLKTPLKNKIFNKKS